MDVSVIAGSSFSIGKNVYFSLGVHRNLVRKGESGRYLRVLGDREDGVIQNSDNHRHAASREEEI